MGSESAMFDRVDCYDFIDGVRAVRMLGCPELRQLAIDAMSHFNDAPTDGDAGAFEDLADEAERALREQEQDMENAAHAELKRAFFPEQLGKLLTVAQDFATLGDAITEQLQSLCDDTRIESLDEQSIVALDYVASFLNDAVDGLRDLDGEQLIDEAEQLRDRIRSYQLHKANLPRCGCGAYVGMIDGDLCRECRS